MSTVQQNLDNAEDLSAEARLEESLEHLKELHLQVRALRTTIPRVIEPLTTHHPTPEALFSSVAKSVTDTNKELSDIRAAMTSEESKKLFDTAHASRQAKPKGIRPWRVTEDPNWTTLSKKKL